MTQDQEEGSGRLTAVLHSAEPQGSSLKLLGFRCLEKEYHCYTSALHSASKFVSPLDRLGTETSRGLQSNGGGEDKREANRGGMFGGTAGVSEIRKVNAV